jgi:hypothetical protein
MNLYNSPNIKIGSVDKLKIKNPTSISNRRKAIVKMTVEKYKRENFLFQTNIQRIKLISTLKIMFSNQIKYLNNKINC